MNINLTAIAFKTGVSLLILAYGIDKLNFQLSGLYATGITFLWIASVLLILSIEKITPERIDKKIADIKEHISTQYKDIETLQQMKENMKEQVNGNN